ncbi:MAG: AAA family ATPase, partial [Clostridia bacterium]|nr:AAA family ATPase [Clostridia bacterium]
MLASLHVENIAVIQRLDVDFQSGFTALTGETGAGKSVLLDCLRLLMGNKAEKDLLRHGESGALVSALFTDISPSLWEELDELGYAPDEDGCMELSRTLSEDGKSIARCNGRSVSLSSLREISALLLHIHGQDDTGLIRKEGSELSILDAAAGCGEEKKAYSRAYKTLTETQNALQALRMDESEKLRKIEMLKYQIGELEEVSPKEGEEEELLDEKIRLRNIEKIARQTSFAYRAIKGGEKANACYILDRAAASLRTVSDVVPKAGEIAGSLEEQLSVLEELAAEVEALTEFDGVDATEALDKVEERIAAISRLSRTYGGSAKAAAEYLLRAKEELSLLESLSSRAEEAEEAYLAAYREAEKAADALFSVRGKAAEALQSEAADMLRSLDMPYAELD